VGLWGGGLVVFIIMNFYASVEPNNIEKLHVIRRMTGLTALRPLRNVATQIANIC
jgi:hypothetical protein